MESQDDKTEDHMRKQLAHIRPSRVFFERVMGVHVTKDTTVRYTNEREVIRSPYQISSLTNLFMKRSYVIAVIALVVVVGATTLAVTRGSRPATVASTATPATPSAHQTPASTSVSNTNGDIGSKDAVASTIDSAVGAILQDNAAVAADTAKESNDGATVNADLQNYSNINDSSYVSTI